MPGRKIRQGGQTVTTVMPTTWTHCNMDIKILTKRSLDKADVDLISTHPITSWFESFYNGRPAHARLLATHPTSGLHLAGLQPRDPLHLISVGPVPKPLVQLLYLLIEATATTTPRVN